MRISPQSDSQADAGRSEKTSRSSRASKEEKETKRKSKEIATTPSSSDDKDANVSLSGKSKSKSKAGPDAPAGATSPKAEKRELTPKPATEDKEMAQAEQLMEHVESGKLSPQERNLAMNRVEDVLKKYGKA